MRIRRDSGHVLVAFQCFGCHEAARDFDFICGDDHGCITLPLSDELIPLSQQLDPRCTPPTPAARSGHRVAARQRQ